MNVLAEYGKEDLAKVYIASMREDNRHLVEFVESLQPPIPREQKWVLIVSSLFGCPVGCRICDASDQYFGRLTRGEILAQIDYMIRRRFPDGNVPIPKFKIQFARMGEPSLNPDVLSVLEILPEKYDVPGLMPSVSTIAPIGTEEFFERLISIKNGRYPDGRFQLQFSIHTTDPEMRDNIIPSNKWDFTHISSYGKRFYTDGDRKVTLNFITINNCKIDFGAVREHFDPDIFVIKLTPLNPTKRAIENGFTSVIDPYDPSSADEIVNGFKSQGFDVILSIGEVEENNIGSNCGQFVSVFRGNHLTIREGYDSGKYLVMDEKV